MGTNQESDESTTASEDKVKHESSVGEKGRRDGETERVKDITITEIESVRTCDDVTQERDGSDEEGEKTPIPPPRRKRKKKLQKNPSLENLEVYMYMYCIYTHFYTIKNPSLENLEVYMYMYCIYTHFYTIAFN